MKRIFLSTLTVFVTSLVFGQTSFGIKAGLNLATTNGFVTENKYIVAPHLGAYSDIKIVKRFFLHPELLYTVKGYRFPLIGVHSKGTLAFSYVTIPFLFGFKPTEKAAIKVGPEVGYLLNAKYRFADSTANHPEYFNKVDLSLDFGITYQVTKKLSTELRYNYGFKGLVDVTYADQYGNQTGKGKLGAHRLFQLSINYELTGK
ncbi:MAG: outer membrane beta-barrel protein [Flavisolibacter sp.]